MPPERIPAGLEAQVGALPQPAGRQAGAGAAGQRAGRRAGAPAAARLARLPGPRDQPQPPHRPGRRAKARTRWRLDLLTAAEARDLLSRRLGPEPGRPRAGRGRRDHRRLRAAAAGADHRRRPRRRQPGFPAGRHRRRAARGQPASLDPFDGGDLATDVRAVFSWSYRALSADAARLFRLLGLHPGPDIAVAAAASLAGIAPDRARGAAGRAGPRAPARRAQPGPVRLARPAPRLRRRAGARARRRRRCPRRRGGPGPRPLPAHRPRRREADRAVLRPGRRRHRRGRRDGRRARHRRGRAGLVHGRARHAAGRRPAGRRRRPGRPRLAARVDAEHLPAAARALERPGQRRARPAWTPPAGPATRRGRPTPAPAGPRLRPVRPLPRRLPLFTTRLRLLETIGDCRTAR